MDVVVNEILTRLPMKTQTQTELSMDVVVDEILTRLPVKTQTQTELPMDVVVDEILTRLPVKTLSRFRCVSKQWLSLISGPRFQKKHYLRSQQSPLLLVAKPIPNSTLVRLSIYTSQGVSLLNEFFLRFAGSDINNMVTLELTQSCLGLLCLRTLFDGAILVFNPSTKEMITLPERPDQECDICIGFGHTASAEEIKVVRFFTLGDVDDLVCFCEVFTLGTSNGWREAKSPPYRPFPNAHLPLLYGALHFLPCLHYHDHVLDDHYITAFDLHTEHYTKVSLPDIYFRDAKFITEQAHLAELRGSLCLIFDLFFCNRLLQLWLLKDYHAGKWLKSYNINLSSHSCFTSPLAITADDCILLNTRSRKDEEISYYDTQKNCITKKIETDCCAVFYIDSFTPLGRKDYLSNHQIA